MKKILCCTFCKFKTNFKSWSKSKKVHRVIKFNQETNIFKTIY